MTREEAKKRRQEIAKLLKERSLWEINRTRLAEQYHVSVPAITHDIKIILSNIPQEDLAEIKYNLKHLLTEAIHEARVLLHNPDLHIKASGVQATLSCARDYLSLLQNIGEVPKIPDKLDVTEKEQEKVMIKIIDTDIDDFFEWCKKNDKPEVIQDYEEFKRGQFKRPVIPKAPINPEAESDDLEYITEEADIS